MLGLPRLNINRLRRLTQEGGWIVLGQVAAVGGAIFGIRLMTELLEPSAYGELALGITMATLLNQTVFGPLGNGIARFYAPAQERGELGGYMNAVRRLLLGAAGVAVLAALIAIASLQLVGRTQGIAITCAAFVFAATSGGSGILGGIQNAARNRKVFALHQGVETWARFLLAAGLMTMFGATSTVAMVGYVLSSTAILISQSLFLKNTIGGSTTGAGNQRGWSRSIVQFSWPFSLFGIFTWTQLASDRWALEVCATTKDVGLYAALFQLGYYPMSIATGMAMQFLSPILYQRAGDANDAQRNASVRLLSWRLGAFALSLTIGAFLVAFGFHSQLFRVFLASEYRSVSYLLPWVVLAGGVFSVGQTISLNLMSQMRPKALIAPKVVTAAFGAVLNVAGAYWYGIEGVVAAGVAFAVSYTLWIAALSMNDAATPASAPDRGDKTGKQ